MAEKHIGAAKSALTAAVLALSAGAAAALTLEDGFKTPPRSARPHTWYHMMNGNVTKEGITRDFEEIAKAGLGGIEIFDTGCSIPPGELAFNTPEWFDMLLHVSRETRRLGLEFCIHNCSGWSSSGGPWNMPSNGMKQVVFTETPVKGPAKFNARLPRTDRDNGFYEDIAVLAFPVPPADNAQFPGVRQTISGKTAEVASASPFTVSGVSFRLSYERIWVASGNAVLETSSDGKTFKVLEKFYVPLCTQGDCDFTLRYHPFKNPVTARAIRITFASTHPFVVEEFRPEKRLRISNIKSKTFDIRRRFERDTTPSDADQVVSKAGILDLTSRMAADGTLAWDVPPGEWTIMRVGYVCNGKCNHPASAGGKGLEADKLSASAIDWHFSQYAGRLSGLIGPQEIDGKSGFTIVHVDSFERASQNWTRGLERTFERRMGYSPVPWLPVFTGRAVGSLDESERFLEDFRRVVSDLFAENYTGRLAELCHERGLRLSVEPYGNCPADNLQYGSAADIPMAEFWSCAASSDHTSYVGNTKHAANISHVWGRRYTAAESFTAAAPDGGRWTTTPFSLKAQCDRVYAQGINRIVYHTYTHQPWVDPAYLPGMTMGRWGMHLGRTQTWWGLAGDWFRYQARCQWILQEGTFVADALFFCGEQAPNDGTIERGMQLPAGYAWDICESKAMALLEVKDGRVVVPGGVSYALLALPTQDTMSEKMLVNVERLVDAGAKVCCMKKPTRAPGLVGYPDADVRVRAAADRIWAKGVMACRPAEALKRLRIAPDFTSAERDPKRGAVYIHRRCESADWYFVALNNSSSKSFEASFRIAGRQPEIWNAEQGSIVDAPVWREENGRTVVTLDFPPSGSSFVVFRRPVRGDHVADVAATVSRRPEPVPPAKHTLAIEEAFFCPYGVDRMPENGLGKDIKAALEACITNGSLSVVVDCRFAGGDPSPGQFKWAYVTYVYDGVRNTVVARQDSELSIPAGRMEPDFMPDWEWRDGKILASQPLSATLRSASGAIRHVMADPPPAVGVGGSWNVTFPVDWYTGGNATKNLVFDKLADWTENADPDIRYFSGTATYRKSVKCKMENVKFDRGDRIMLDLGEVRNFAEVTVNGRKFPVLWRPPYRIDITDEVRQRDEIDLVVKVTNLWPNRLIGDDFLPDDCEWKGGKRNGTKEISVVRIPQWVKDGKPSPTGRHTFTTWKHWTKDETPLPSGLLGPVLLRPAAFAREKCGTCIQTPL